MTGAGWESVPLGDVLQQRTPHVAVDPSQCYQFAGVYSFARGVFRAQERMGTETSYRVLVQLRSGEFVYPKLMAWEGGFGVVPPECDGCYVSPEFQVFQIDGRRVLPRWIELFFKVPAHWREIAGGSIGTNMRRQRLHPKDLLKHTVLLPPLDEQGRIVARIDALAAKIVQARGLKAESKFSCDRFWKTLSAMARSVRFPTRPLEEIVEFLDGRRIPLSEAERQGRKGKIPYYGASGIIDFVDDYIFDEPLVLLSEDGANLIARSKPIAFIAEGKYWVNNHAHVLKPDPALMDMRFLAYALSDYDVSQFNFASAQAKLNQRYARQITLPVPPLLEQRRIVAELDALQAKVDAVKRLQAETAAEIDALLPAILDRAIKGEL